LKPEESDQAKSFVQISNHYIVGNTTNHPGFLTRKNEIKRS